MDSKLRYNKITEDEEVSDDDNDEKIMPGKEEIEEGGKGTLGTKASESDSLPPTSAVEDVEGDIGCSGLGDVDGAWGGDGVQRDVGCGGAGGARGGVVADVGTNSNLDPVLSLCASHKNAEAYVDQTADDFTFTDNRHSTLSNGQFMELLGVVVSWFFPLLFHIF